MDFQQSDTNDATRPRIEITSFSSGLSEAESSDRGRKLWKNAARDEAIVRVSTAFAEGRWAELRSFGLLEQQTVIPTHLGDGRRTDVLVSNAQHAEHLSRLLQGAFAVGNHRVPLEVRPIASITTRREARKDRHYAPSVIVNSLDAPNPYWSTVGDPPMGRVLVELFDEAYAVSERDGLLRLLHYWNCGCILPKAWANRLTQFWLDEVSDRDRTLNEDANRVLGKLAAATSAARADRP